MAPLKLKNPWHRLSLDHFGLQIHLGRVFPESDSPPGQPISSQLPSIGCEARPGNMDFIPPTSPTTNRRQQLLSRLRLATPAAPKPPPSLPPPPLATDPNATANPGFFPRPQRPTHSRLLLSAISRGPRQLAMYRGREIAVEYAGKVFPLFLNGRGGKWKGGWRPAMGFPLLNSTSWAQEPLKRLFEEVVSILEGLYGHNLDDFRPRVVGFDYVDMETASLDDFLSSQEASTAAGRLVLGFTLKAKEE